MKVYPVLFFIALFLFVFTAPGFAEERSIYVGDLIEIRITAPSFTEEEIREKFSDFEITDLKTDGESYLLTLRTFEPGEKKILLGDKEIVITVESTLEALDRTEVFEGSPEPEKPGFSPDWRVFFFMAAFLFAASGVVVFLRFLKKRGKALLTPYQRFLQEIGGIVPEERGALVRMTLCLKEYLESTFSFRIRGKTSGEIMAELSRLPDFDEKLPRIRTWLKECDYLKFSGTVATHQKKQELCDELREIVGQLEESKEGKA